MKPGTSPSSSAGVAESTPAPSTGIQTVASPALQRRDSPYNFLLLAAYHVVMRCGWIFKTESIIMPIVLDLLGGGAWLRSLLPLLSRFGQSVPPLLLARRVKVLPEKKWALAICSGIMALTFLILAAVWALPQRPSASWLALIFLCLYSVFFMSTGVNQMCFSTLQGKLVETTRRGRLLLVSNLVGSIGAIGLVAWLLPFWLTDNGGRFEWIFGFTGLCFAVATVLSMSLRETPDNFQQPARRFRQYFLDALQILTTDHDFRRLAMIAASFGVSVMLFPHYQALGRGERLGIGLREIIGWIIVQNAGTALFSLLVGPLADWRGNRLVLRFSLLALCGAPLLALWLWRWGPAFNAWFSLVFLLVGLTPVIIKTIHNFTLEVAQPEDHPRYLSTITLCMAAPILLSPLVGGMIKYLGYQVVFLGVTAVMLMGWVLSFTLFEPRHAANS